MISSSHERFTLASEKSSSIRSRFSRIRTIKPEFWRSPDITSLSSYFVRLFFIGLWTYVDDNGVGDDDVDLIRSDLFPRDNVEEVGQLIHGALSECSHKGLIVRYEDSVSGRRYLQVVNWHHQRINRPSKSSKPLPSSGNNPVSEGSVSTHGAVREPSLNTHGALSEGSLQEGIKGTREQGRGGAAAAPPPTPQETANSEQETIGPYGPRCPDHRDDPDPPSCPGCKRARLAVEARERDTAERAHAEREQIRMAIDDCDLCDEFGRLDDQSDCPEHPNFRQRQAS